MYGVQTVHGFIAWVIETRQFPLQLMCKGKDKDKLSANVRFAVQGSQFWHGTVC